MPSRLNKFIAHASGVSRREADDLISQGRVIVNGRQASLGQQINDNDHVQVGDTVLTNDHGYVYVAFHKPTGYVCSRRRQGDTPTIYELLPEKYHSLKPVGRLDKDSSGILLLTNDGDFAHQMTHPSFHKMKRYEVKLNYALEPLHRQMVSDYGVTLDDGPSKLQLEKAGATGKEWIVNMHEGRNRQIRRTFASLGYTVMQLHRTDFGAYDIGDIASGQFQLVQK